MMRIILIVGVLGVAWLLLGRGTVQSTIPGPDPTAPRAADAAEAEPTLSDRLENAGNLVLDSRPRGRTPSAEPARRD